MAESETSSQVSNTAASKKEQATAANLIYAGPPIHKYGLARFRVYQGGMPKHCEELFEACPAVKRLIIDVEKLSAVLQQIEQKGSAYHTWYAEAMKYAKEG